MIERNGLFIPEEKDGVVERRAVIGERLQWADGVVISAEVTHPEVISAVVVELMRQDELAARLS